MRYRLDPTLRRLGDGRVVLGGSPLKLMRLTEAGARWVRRAADGDDIAPNTLLDRLVDNGALHPAPTPADSPFTTADITVVIPTRNGDVHDLLAALVEVASVIVVDDASEPAIARRTTETSAGVRVVRHEHSQGPGPARTTGLALVTTALVAFVDDDVMPTAGWLQPLLAHFADPSVALVAPRVASGAATGPARSAELVAAYERVRSPLDMGERTGPVRAGTRVSYVPAAALVCRADAVREIGGFDPGLRVGEDVDLVWRLDEAGWRCRYEPGSVVHHRPRSTLRAFAAQRVAYGRSAAPLSIRHPGALAPVRVSGWSALVWLLAVVGAPTAAVAVGVGTVVALARKLRTIPRAGIESLRLAGLGHLYAGRQIASALTRAWWPLTLAAALVSRRARRALALAIIVPAVFEWRSSRPSIDAARYGALRVIDDAAYGVGLWQGAWREPTTEPLLPDLTTWPRRSRAERAAGRRPGAGRREALRLEE